MHRLSDPRAMMVEFCRCGGLFRDRRSVLAAVSGGADSVVLLHLLAESADELGLIEIAVGHVNHGIRAEAGRDEAFVARLAADLGMRCFIARVDVPTIAGDEGRSIEDAGRLARYRELFRMANENRLEAVATGHTMTDQAETVLMRMIRGTGPLGLAGVAARTDDGLVRPMLGLTAAQVRQYAKDRGFAHVEDDSNSDEYFLRNRIRGSLMPMLREFNPGIEGLLAGLAGDAAALGRLVDAVTAPHVARIDADRFLVRASVPADIAPYAVREAFKQVTGEPLGLSRKHIQALTNALSTGACPQQFILPRRVVVFLRPEGLLFTRDMEGPPPGSARGRSAPNPR